MVVFKKYLTYLMLLGTIKQLSNYLIFAIGSFLASRQVDGLEWTLISLFTQLTKSMFSSAVSFPSIYCLSHFLGFKGLLDLINQIQISCVEGITTNNVCTHFEEKLLNSLWKLAFLLHRVWDRSKKGHRKTPWSISMRSSSIWLTDNVL